MQWTQYRKGIVAAVIAVAIAGLTALEVALGDGYVSSREWVVVALAVLGAIGVYAFPNDPVE